MKKYITLIFIVVVLFSSCQSGKKEKVDRVYLINDSDSIKNKISKVENNLLPALTVEGAVQTKYNLIERMNFYSVPSISIAVIDNGKISWAKAYGKKEYGEEDSVNINTLYQAASLSKPLTATVTLKLSDKGKIQLDQEVNNQLSSWNIPNNEYTIDSSITPRMLLLHTSGLDNPGFPGYNVNDTIPQIEAILKGNPPAENKAFEVKFVPNTDWSYSGGGYMVLQYLLENVENTDFESIMKSELFEPLEMTNSTFIQPLPENLRKNASKGHYKDSSTVNGGWHVYPEQAAAGLWTTSLDLAKLIVELQKSANNNTNKILKNETTINMLSKHWISMGLGYLIRNEKENIAFTFNGGNEGYRCDFYAYLYKGKGAVIMTNSENGQGLINEVYRSIAKVYDWQDYQQEIIKPIDYEKLNIESVLGNYVTYWPNGEEYPFSISSENNVLFFHHENKKYKMVPESESVLYVIDYAWKLDFSEFNRSNSNHVNCFLEFGHCKATKQN